MGITGGALAIDGTLAEVHNSLGFALQVKRAMGEARGSYERAIELRPGLAEAHLNLAMLLLSQGEYGRGWREYEWRLGTREHAGNVRNSRRPRWDGGELGGRRILLHAEQGFGDAIQFVRYLPMVEERGGRVILECHRELRRLLMGVKGVEVCVVRGEELPAFEVECPLPSLPGVFGTEGGSVPGGVPYVFADGEMADQWAKRVGTGLKVGLVWSGNPAFKGDRVRSVRELALLGALGEVEGVTFFSLQKGAAGLQVKGANGGLRVVDWTGELGDFAETAGLVANMDLVISVDTAVAHLAGGMGKRVWVMLSVMADWRWGWRGPRRRRGIRRCGCFGSGGGVSGGKWCARWRGRWGSWREGGNELR